jgi:hypothetical protein
MRVALLLIILASIAKPTIAAECPKLLDSIRQEFRLRNSSIQDVQILDVKPKLSHYWVVARGNLEDPNPTGNLDDELFGLFVVSPNLEVVESVLDVFPTKRWHDYSLWIESYTIEQVVLRGKGATYGDEPFEATYNAP